MSLQSCPECGKQISSTAGVCPNCGYRSFSVTKKIGKGVGTGMLIAVTCPIVFIAFYLIWGSIADAAKYGIGRGSDPNGHPFGIVFAALGTVALAIVISVCSKRRSDK
jgi:hypothetical protein